MNIGDCARPKPSSAILAGGLSSNRRLRWGVPVEAITVYEPNVAQLLSELIAGLDTDASLSPRTAWQCHASTRRVRWLSRPGLDFVYLQGSAHIHNYILLSHTHSTVTLLQFYCNNLLTDIRILLRMKLLSLSNV